MCTPEEPSRLRICHGTELACLPLEKPSQKASPQTQWIDNGSEVQGKGSEGLAGKEDYFFFSSAAQELAVCCMTWIQGPSPLLPQVVTGAVPLVTWYRGRDPVRPREEAQPGSQPSDGNKEEEIIKKMPRKSAVSARKPGAFAQRPQQNSATYLERPGRPRKAGQRGGREAAEKCLPHVGRFLSASSIGILGVEGKTHSDSNIAQ